MPNLIEQLYSNFNNLGNNVGTNFLNGLGAVREASTETFNNIRNQLEQNTQARSSSYTNPLTKKIDEYFSTLTWDETEKGQQAREDLVMELVLTALGGISAQGAKAIAKPIIKQAMSIFKKSGPKAASNFVKGAVAEARNKAVTQTINNSRKATSIGQQAVKEELKRTPFTNPQLEREFQNFTSRFPNATKEQFATHLQRNNKNLYTYFQRESNRFPTTQTNKVVRNNEAVSNLTEQTVEQTAQQAVEQTRNNRNIAEVYDEAKNLFKGKFDEAIQKINNIKTRGNRTPEEWNLIQLVKRNTEHLQQLANQTGVTSAKEIPNLIKFAKQMGDIVKNSPKNIKAIASGGKPITIAATGLSVYDLYQAFKEGGNDLIPRVVRDVTGVASTFIPGGALAKIIYGSLGYTGGDRLSRWAMRKLGFDNKNTNMQAEYDSGMAYPGLHEYVDEYQTGQSGRRYHVVGDRIYAFDTGRPVSVQQAIDDINARLAYEDQQLQDKIKQNENQLADIQQALNAGYNVPQETIQNVANNYQQLQQQAQNRPSAYNLTDYDINQDIIEQVRNEEQQQAQQAATGQSTTGQSFAEQIITRLLQPQQTTQVNSQRTFTDVFNTVAQDTYQALGSLITPISIKQDYDSYLAGSFSGQNVGTLSEQEFLEATKMKAMQQLAPKIFETTNSIIESYKQNNPGVSEETLLKLLDYDLNVRKQAEVERNNIAGNIIQARNADETIRHNQATEGLDYFKAGETQRSNLADEAVQRQNAITSRMNAQTSAREQAVREQLMPYQQANYIGQTVINSAMSDLPMDQIINSNPQVFGQVFSGAVKRNNNQIQLP